MYFNKIKIIWATIKIAVLLVLSAGVGILFYSRKKYKGKYDKTKAKLDSFIQNEKSRKELITISEINRKEEIEVDKMINLFEKQLEEKEKKDKNDKKNEIDNNDSDNTFTSVEL